MTHTRVFFLPAVLASGMLIAQTGPATPARDGDRQMDITGALAEPLVYTPPTPADRWRYLYNDAFSPASLAVHSVQGAFRQTINFVPEWGHGADGYGRRLAWTVVNNVAQSTIESGVAAALHEDIDYYRCACNGFWRRSAHALVSQVTARRSDGSLSFSLARPIGAYGGALAAAPLLPNRFTLQGDAIREGTWNYGMGFSVNMLREFWPEIRRGLFRKK